MRRSLSLWIAVLFLLIAGVKTASAQCSPDITPPVVTALSQITLQLASNQSATVNPADLDNGTDDNCTPAGLLNFFIAPAPASATPPSSTSLTFQGNNPGTYAVVLWAVDAAGNSSFITSEVVVSSCNNQLMICNALVNVSLDASNMATVVPADILEGGPYCPSNLYSMSLDGVAQGPEINLDLTDIGTHVVAVSSVANGAVLGTCWGELVVDVNCTGDIVPPVPVCITGYQVNVNPGSTAPVLATDINAGSTDNCSLPPSLMFNIENGGPSATPPNTVAISVNGNAPGIFPVTMWVTDANGNSDYCQTIIEVLNCNQSNLACNASVTVSLGASNTATVYPSDILEGTYCPTNIYSMALDGMTMGPVLNLTPNNLGTHVVAVSSVGGGVVLGTCWGELIVVQSGCTNDALPPVVVGEFQVDLVIDLSSSSTAVLTPAMVDDGSYDNCTPAGQLVFAVREIDTQGNPLGAFASELVFGVSQLGTHLVEMQVTDLAGNHNSIVTVVEVSLKDPVYHLISGNVFQDGNADCTLQSGAETGLQNWVVMATGVNTGASFVGNTDSNGDYSIEVNVEETEFEVGLQAAYNYGGTACATTYTVNFPILAVSDTQTVHIPVQLDTLCPRMLIDLATPKIRPCFPGTYYVHFTNASAAPIADTYVQVQLDEYLAYQGSTIPGTDLGNQLYEFETGTLNPGESGNFAINFMTDCNAPFGATHCSEAHIYPDTLCPESPFWSGANVAVEGYCLNDTIYLQITNNGTGANAQLLNYIVVEDVLMRESGQFLLAPGGVKNIDPIPGNGATFRLQADQEPGHPYGGTPWVTVEGCAGLTPGLVTAFPTNNPNPFVATYCRENTSSFDPNAKEALPVGYGSNHLILPNTPLEYQIQFQNLGTDTAFKVVVLDTLSNLLDAHSLRPGSASHPYSFALLDGNVARFTFDPIVLPQLAVNEEGSQGFIQFTIDQVADNPDGSTILNSAAIYFDFNAPVITNETFHEVSTHFMEVSGVNHTADYPVLRTYPNPATDFVYFDVPGFPSGDMRFTLTNAQGQLVKAIPAASFPVRLDRDALPVGMYYFSIEARGAVRWSGKIMLK